MSESLVSISKQLYPSGRPSYRKSNSYIKMSRSRSSKNGSGSSYSNTSVNDVDESIENNSIDNTFNSNEIITASTPTKEATFPGYPHEELARMSNDNLERSYSTYSKTSKKDQKQTAGNSNTQSYFNINYIWIFLIVIFVPILIRMKLDKSNINIDELKEKFPDQPNETWLNFEAIIDDILIINPTHPAVFLLLYTKKTNKVKNLIDHLGKYASMKLETNEDYIYVNNNEFHSEEAVNDYGYLIDKYEKDLIKKKVMVVEDLQEISGTVAQAFHTLCDEISPLVDKVVYIFTLKVDSLNGKEETIAETYLKRFWNDLDNDILMPLVTRVTSTVIKIVN